MSEPKRNYTAVWAVPLVIFMGGLLGLTTGIVLEDRKDGDGFVVGCTNPANGELHVYQSERRPVVVGSLIHLGDKVYTTPYPGGVCRIMSAAEFEQVKEESLAKQV